MYMHDSATSVPPTLLVESPNMGHPAGILRANHYRQPQGYRVFRPAGRRDRLLFFTIGGEGCFKSGEQFLGHGGRDHDYSTGHFAGLFDCRHRSGLGILLGPFCAAIPLAALVAVSRTMAGHARYTASRRIAEPRVIEAFEWLIKDSFSSNAIHEELALNSLEQVILLSASQGQGLKNLDQRIETVLELMSQQLDASLNVSELARQVVLSPSRLAHLFKAQVGDSIVATHLSLDCGRRPGYWNLPIGQLEKSL